MMGSGFKAVHLWVGNLLKLLEKKMELAQKAGKEIADYLASKGDELAQIQGEHLIWEDCLVTALEILELYCDLLLVAQRGLIHSMKEINSSLAASVSTQIEGAPWFQSEMPELKIVADQLCVKYSKEYRKLCKTTPIRTVNDRLMHKLNVEHT